MKCQICGGWKAVGITGVVVVAGSLYLVGTIKEKA